MYYTCLLAQSSSLVWKGVHRGCSMRFTSTPVPAVESCMDLAWMFLVPVSGSFTTAPPTMVKEGAGLGVPPRVLPSILSNKLLGATGAGSPAFTTTCCLLYAAACCLLYAACVLPVRLFAYTSALAASPSAGMSTSSRMLISLLVTCSVVSSGLRRSGMLCGDPKARHSSSTTVRKACRARIELASLMVMSLYALPSRSLGNERFHSSSSTRQAASSSSRRGKLLSRALAWCSTPVWGSTRSVVTVESCMDLISRRLYMPTTVTLLMGITMLGGSSCVNQTTLSTTSGSAAPAAPPVAPVGRVAMGRGTKRAAGKEGCIITSRMECTLKPSMRRTYWMVPGRNVRSSSLIFTTAKGVPPLISTRSLRFVPRNVSPMGIIAHPQHMS
mmetsp:Transcript_30670/g.66082  ORF Transcript_30670/g.66082 Transcript_30670/m.66082 type:complete len:386 (+) Transcript_30670:62-1219(+)